ncbi:hypothetical protein AB2B38_007680 [Balneola sp. MJW-20]|uniref:hypothetical protein n=1 Tax=Gracilimonas aurantiaca TaxID=3234185 RepID=UPI003467C487
MNAIKNFKLPLIKVAAITAVLLSIPLTVMQFTNEVVWSGSDFLIAGLLLFGAGAAYVLIRQRMDNSLYRIATGLGTAAMLFLLWSNGAVGLIGSENDPANLMYLGVIAVGLIGALISGLKPRGLSYTFFAMSVSLLIITVIALITGMQNLPGSSVNEILAVNGVFIVLFTLPAILYRKLYMDGSGDPEAQS